MTGGEGRYARQEALSLVGIGGQARLGAATVAIVGCGALGSAQAELLARAGVGHLVVVDRDVLELHNLARQSLFDEDDVARRLPKAVAAERHLRAMNSSIRVEGVFADVTAARVEDLVAGADLVLDGTDNLETRYLLNDAAVKHGRPWVYGGVLATEGTVMAVRPGAGPCLRCVFEEPPPPGTVPTCATRGVLNTAVATVAALQVTEALKILLADPQATFALHALDVWRGTHTRVTVPRRAGCPCCGARRFEFLDAGRGSSTTVLCGRNTVQVTPDPGWRPDLAALEPRLRAIGPVTATPYLLELAVDPHRLLVLQDGRILVMGTTEPAEARSLVARYVGV